MRRHAERHTRFVFRYSFMTSHPSHNPAGEAPCRWFVHSSSPPSPQARSPALLLAQRTCRARSRGGEEPAVMFAWTIDGADIVDLTDTRHSRAVRSEDDADQRAMADQCRGLKRPSSPPTDRSGFGDVEATGGCTRSSPSPATRAGNSYRQARGRKSWAPPICPRSDRPRADEAVERRRRRPSR